MAENRKVLERKRTPGAADSSLLPIVEAPRSGAGPRTATAAPTSISTSPMAPIIAPAYGIAEDASKHIEALRRAYPDRSVVPVALKDLFRGGGGIHCITQQDTGKTC
jgi:agmatine deiminase